MTAHVPNAAGAQRQSGRAKSVLTFIRTVDSMWVKARQAAVRNSSTVRRMLQSGVGELFRKNYTVHTTGILDAEEKLRLLCRCLYHPPRLKGIL